MKSLSIQDQIAQRMASLNLDSIGVQHTPAQDNFAEPETEPVIIPVEPLVVKTETIKPVKEATAFKWCKTRLHLVLVQSAEVDEVQLGEFNGKTVRLDMPLSNTGTEDHKTLGYLNAFFKPFVKQLKAFTAPEATNMLGTSSQCDELYSKMAIAVLENVYRLLPRTEDNSNRISVFASISTEKNSLVDDVVIDFYVSYHTAYNAEELFSKINKTSTLQRALDDGYLTDNFSFITTAVFPISKTPEDIKLWKAEGFTLEDWSTTRMLPIDRDNKAEILGVVPETKRPMPSVILSRMFEPALNIQKVKKNKKTS